jgi:glycerophosphoryl diester phosphodiesterase
VLELLAPTPLLLNVELKNSVVDYPGLEEKVLAALDRPEFTGRVVLSSFNLESVRRLGALGTPHRLAALFEYPSAGAFGRTVDVGATAIHPPSAVVWRRGYVRRAHRLGLAVRPWVVNRKSSMGRMFRWGVDGIFTDLPDVALRIRTDT